MSALSLGLVSLVVWVLLWGDASPGNVASGVVVAGLLMAVFPNDGPFWPRHYFNPVHAARFVAFFGWNLIVSNVVLARQIISPRSRIKTGVVVVPMPDCTPALLTFVANVTALTPGTMAVEASSDPPALTVHVLLHGDPDRARATIDELRFLAVRAFGSPESRDDCVRLIEPGDDQGGPR